MKFCLKSGQISSYLKKADEIIINYNNRFDIPKLTKKYPQAELVLEIPPTVEWKIDELKELYYLSKNKLKFCLPRMSDPEIIELKDAGIPFFWGYEITTGYELEALIRLGVCEARIGAPLFFCGDFLKTCGIPLRVTPNIAHNGYIPETDGIVGSWIRPEDIDMYENIFNTIEFADCDVKKEQALYRIYAEKKHWPGEIHMIISNLEDKMALNRLLFSEDFTKTRLNCGQKCMTGGSCKICYRLVNLANRDLIKDYAESMNLI